MRQVLLSFLLLLACCVPTTAQQSIYGLVERSTFMMYTEDAAGNSSVGTAFCVPDRSSQLMTAAHTVGPQWEIYDSKGETHQIAGIFADAKKDIAVITLKDPACVFSALKWAAKNAVVGAKAWVFGYGGAFAKPVLTTGIISSEIGAVLAAPGLQLAQLNALRGHSGSAVTDDTGKIIGMLVSGYENGDVINGIIPVDALRKAVK